jgi:hypothetical protein
VELAFLTVFIGAGGVPSGFRALRGANHNRLLSRCATFGLLKFERVAPRAKGFKVNLIEPISRGGPEYDMGLEVSNEATPERHPGCRDAQLDITIQQPPRRIGRKDRSDISMKRSARSFSLKGAVQAYECLFI